LENDPRGLYIDPSRASGSLGNDPCAFDIDGGADNRRSPRLDMAVMPPFDPISERQGESTDAGQQVDPEFRYVSEWEAGDEDRVTFLDKLAIVGAVAVAQLVRLGIIFAAIGIIVLFFFLGSKL
jgi:hypothetical protein